MVSPPDTNTGSRWTTQWFADERHRNILTGAVVILTVAITTTLACWAWQAQTTAGCLTRYTQDTVAALEARDKVIDDARMSDIAIKASGRDTLTRILESIPTNGRAPSVTQIQAARSEIERYIPRLDEHVTALNTARTAARTYPLPTADCVS